MAVILFGKGANRSTVPVTAYDSMVFGLRDVLEVFDEYDSKMYVDGDVVDCTPKNPNRCREIRFKLETLSVRAARDIADQMFDSHGWRGDPPFSYVLRETNNELQVLYGTDG